MVRLTVKCSLLSLLLMKGNLIGIEVPAGKQHRHHMSQANQIVGELVPLQLQFAQWQTSSWFGPFFLIC